MSVVSVVRRRPVVLALLAALALVTACTGGKDAVDQNAGGQFRYVQTNKAGTVIPLKDRKTAGVVSAKLLDGAPYTSTADAGKVLMFSYFASWCGPCQTEMPQIEQFYQQHKASDFTVVGVDTKEPSADTGKSWVAGKGLTFPVISDQVARTALQLGKIPVALPSTVILDKQHRVAAIYLGSVLPADLAPVISQLTAES